MATGILGTVTTTAPLTYTAASNAKVVILAAGSGVTVDGTGVAAGSSAFFVGRGQTITVSTTSAQALISTLEEAS